MSPYPQIKTARRLGTTRLPWLCAILAAASPLLPANQEADRAELDHFENRVRPLLADKCFKCHGPKKQRGGLRLDSVAGLLSGGEGGTILVPGELEASRLIQAVRYGDEDLQMPPKSKLDSKAIADLERWVSQGLHMPEPEQAHAPAQATEDSFNLEERRQHWSFQALSNPRVPTVERTEWPRTAVDRFLLARLEAEQLEPAADAEASDWLRRVSFAIVGLPPTTEDLNEFLGDPGPGARERVVDRLLESQQFGERWGRHWLDLMRYAETRGHEFDFPIPNAWQYRDYVVRAFNADVPYDRFVREHVAGDLLPTPRPNPTLGFDESPLGTGFWFLGDGAHSPVDIRADETERVANQVDVFSRAFLGLTVACARCHDHKFDAITAEDFYSLSGFVMSGSYRQARFETVANEELAAQELQTLQSKHQSRLQSTLALAVRDALPHALSVRELAREYKELPLLVDEPAPEDPETKEAKAARMERIKAAKAAHLASFAGERGVGPTALQAWVDELKKARPPIASAATEAELAALFDHDAQGQALLLQDGHCAGEVAQSTGTLLLGSDPARAASGLLEREALHFDSFWNRLTAAPGDQREPTGSSGILPGRMFRTPTFDIEEDLISVLVRGQGFVYAAVDQHRLVRGPLHGVICKSFDTGGAFRWIRLNLRDYVGHRVHLEFSPRGNNEVSLSVAGMRLGKVDTPPPPVHPEDFEAARSRVFEPGASDAADRALIDWILRRPALFPLEHADYLAASAEYARELEALAATQTWESHSAPVMLEGSGFDEFVLLRGKSSTPGDVARRRFLEALGGKQAEPITSGSGRLELAQRLTSPENPFLARVWVNRIWHYLFDRGLVASVDDFGAMGEEPSHPALLDFLAQALMQDGWSTKAMIRRLVLSRAYGMDSQLNLAAVNTDPDNRLLHRMPVHRLDAEALRDSILAVSGGLDPKAFGPSIPVHLTPFLEGRGRPGASGPLDGAGRRSLYLSVRRNFPVPFLGVFDFPNPATTMGRRGNSNVPAQALTLMNDPFVQDQAKRWAQRLLQDPGDDTDQTRVADVYLTALGRLPSSSESSAALDFLRESGELGADSLESWSDLCHVIYNTKEFRYLR